MAALLLTGSVVAAVPAAAQRRAGDDASLPPLSNSVARGPGVANESGLASGLAGAAGALVRGFSISASLGTLYDSNIRRIGDGVDARGREKADFRISPSVAAATVLPLGLQQLYAEGDYGRDFFVRDSERSSDRYGFEVGANLRAGSSCGANVSAGLRRSQSVLSEASIVDDNTIERRNYGASISCQRPAGLGFGVSASRSESDNASEAREVFDSRSTSAAANLSYAFTRLGTVSAGGTFTRVTYPRRTVLVDQGTMLGSDEDAVDIYSGNLNFRRSLGTRITVNAGVSYFQTEPDPRDVVLLIPFVSETETVIVAIPQSRDKFSGAGYNLRLSYRPSARLSADIYGVRSVSASTNVGALYSISDSFGLDIGYNLRSSISTGIGITYDKRRYEDSFPSTDEFQRRADDDITRIYARATLVTRRLISADFEVSHQIRKAQPSIFDYSSTAAQLTLRASFGR